MTNPDTVLAYSAEATEGPLFIECDETGEHAVFIDGERAPSAGLGCGGSMVAQWLTEPNARFFVEARTDLPVLAQAVKAVLAVHVPFGEDEADSWPPGDCSECSSYDHEGLLGCKWPCPTVQALIDAGVEVES